MSMRVCVCAEPLVCTLPGRYTEVLEVSRGGDTGNVQSRNKPKEKISNERLKELKAALKAHV